LTNITRQKLKEAYAQQFNAIVERSEKQGTLAKHARRLLELLDDTPVVPGIERPAYLNERAAKEILLDAEEELSKWRPSQDFHVPSSHLESNLLPSLGNSSAIQSNNHSVTGDGVEPGRPSETNNAETTADAQNPKIPETAI
jgi:hypothetical protein